MGDALKQLILFLRSFGLNYVFFLCSLFLGTALLLPFLDATFYRLPRLEHRARIVTELSKLDQTKLNTNPALQKAYINLIHELDSHESDFPRSLQTYFQTDPEIFSWRAISRFFAGSFLALLLIPALVISQDTPSEKLSTGTVLAVLGIFSGCISLWLPSFHYENVNYFLGAIVQLVLLTSVFIKLSQMNALEELQKNPRPPQVPSMNVRVLSPAQIVSPTKKRKSEEK